MEIFRKKNEATVVVFPMVTTASPETFDTGETVSDDGYYSDAGGAWTTIGGITDTVSEIGSTGLYELSLTAGEMNHDNIIIKFTSTNAADTAVIIRTRAVDEDDLVRATTPANTLDVNATGEAGIDLDNTSGTLAKTTDITGFTDLSAAQVNAEVVDVVATDTFSEIGKSAPLGEDALTMRGVLAQLHKVTVRKLTNDGTTLKIYDDAGTTVDQQAPVSEAAGTVTRSEVVVGA